MLIVEFEENEEQLFRQTMEWLATKLNNSSIHINSNNAELHIDPFTRIVTTKDGITVHLSAKEFDLLYFLFLHKGIVFTKEQLYENVWGYEYISHGSNLTSFIRKLRTKIEPTPDRPQYIITVWGVGYKFNEKKP